MKHFKLISESKLNFLGKTLYRIECTVDFKYAKKGDKGGWVESEKNLSGDAWVYGNARVYGDAEVYGDAWVYGDAEVYGNARVSGDARVSGNAWVYGDAWVYGNAEVYGNARVSGDARVYGNARVCGDARVSGNAEVYGDAEVYGNARVSGNAEVYGNARVYGNAKCTSLAMTLNFIYNLTLTDNHILYGCVIKTVKQWEKWLKSDEVIETPRDSYKFKIIEMALNLAIEYRKQNPIK